MISKTMKRILDRSTTPPMKRRLLAVRDQLLDFNVYSKKVLGRLGSLPDYIIIGAQKGGTTYLYDELIRHPNVAPTLTKEVHFFDANYHKGVDWYRGYFPATLRTGKQRGKQRVITGEASPCYIFHPHAARRISKVVPQVKLIALLRNPVNRAYSHYHHEVRLGFETLPFDEVIAREQERLVGEKEKMLEDGTYYSYNYMHYTYLARGIYVEQLKEWRRFFPEEQMLILKSEDFYKNTPSVMQQVTEFLELPSWQPERYGEPKISHYPKMDEAMRDYLIEYFEPHNQRLYDYLGVNFSWNR